MVLFSQGDVFLQCADDDRFLITAAVWFVVDVVDGTDADAVVAEFTFFDIVFVLILVLLPVVFVVLFVRFLSLFNFESFSPTNKIMVRPKTPAFQVIDPPHHESKIFSPPHFHLWRGPM